MIESAEPALGREPDHGRPDPADERSPDGVNVDQRPRVGRSGSSCGRSPVRVHLRPAGDRAARRLDPRPAVERPCGRAGRQPALRADNPRRRQQPDAPGPRQGLPGPPAARRSSKALGGPGHRRLGVPDAAPRRGGGLGPDYGYRPAIGAIIDRLKTALGGQCLPRTLTPDPNSRAASPASSSRRATRRASCDCNLPGRQAVPRS